MFAEEHRLRKLIHTKNDHKEKTLLLVSERQHAETNLRIKMNIFPFEVSGAQSVYFKS